MLFWKMTIRTSQRSLEQVSILILLDVILEEPVTSHRVRPKIVSILILLDVILEDMRDLGFLIPDDGFNPYFVGCYSGRKGRC